MTDSEAARLGRYATQDEAEQAIARLKNRDRFHTSHVTTHEGQTHPWVVLAGRDKQRQVTYGLEHNPG